MGVKPFVACGALSVNCRYPINTPFTSLADETVDDGGWQRDTYSECYIPSTQVSLLNISPNSWVWVAQENASEGSRRLLMRVIAFDAALRKVCSAQCSCWMKALAVPTNVIDVAHNCGETATPVVYPENALEEDFNDIAKHHDLPLLFLPSHALSALDAYPGVSALCVWVADNVNTGEPILLKLSVNGKSGREST